MKRRNFLKILPTIALLPVTIKELPKPVPLPEAGMYFFKTKKMKPVSTMELNDAFIDAIGKMDKMILNRTRRTYTLDDYGRTVKIKSSVLIPKESPTLDNWETI